MKENLFFLESSKHGGGSINSLNDNVAFLDNYFSINIAYYRKNSYTDIFDNNFKTFPINSAIYSRESFKKKLLSLSAIVNSDSTLGWKVEKQLLSREISTLKDIISNLQPKTVIANISPVFDKPLYYTGYKFIQHVRTIAGINSKNCDHYKPNIQNSVQKLIFNSAYTKQFWESKVGELVPSEIIYNPYKKNKTHQRTGAQLNVGIIARLVKQKNHLKLIDAIGELSKQYPAKLYIYGDGPERDNIERYITGKKINNVFLQGNVNNKDKIYSNLDLVILPSYHEALGRVLIEALSYGIPVIGSDRGGIPEIIEDSCNGFLIDPDNHYTIADSIQKAFDIEMYNKLQEGAIKIFNERFDENRVFPQLLKTYQQTIMKGI